LVAGAAVAGALAGPAFTVSLGASGAGAGAAVGAGAAAAESAVDFAALLLLPHDVAKIPMVRAKRLILINFILFCFNLFMQVYTSIRKR
jgi:hypothetical protein